MTFRTLGPALSQRWGTPADESFWKQGVVVDDAVTLRETDRRLLEENVNRILGETVLLTELRFKAHRPLSNGVWLHTDRQPTTGKRDIHLLLYLDTLRAGDGGEFGLYTHSPTQPHERPCASARSGYISGKPIRLPRTIKTHAVGGEWRHGTRQLRCIQRVVPRRGRAILMDCRQAENVHAVAALRRETARRSLVEAWFHVTHSPSCG